MKVLPIQQLITLNTLIFMYKFHTGHIPLIFKTMCVINSSVHPHKTRQRMLLHKPPVRTTHALNSFQNMGINKWNNLNSNIRSSTTMTKKGIIHNCINFIMKTSRLNFYNVLLLYFLLFSTFFPISSKSAATWYVCICMLVGGGGGLDGLTNVLYMLLSISINVYVRYCYVLICKWALLTSIYASQVSQTIHCILHCTLSLALIYMYLILMIWLNKLN